MKFKNLIFICGLVLGASQLNADTMPNITTVFRNLNLNDCPVNFHTTLKAVAFKLRSMYERNNVWTLQDNQDWSDISDFISNGSTSGNSSTVNWVVDTLTNNGYFTYQNKKCIRYQDAQGKMQWGTAQEFLQGLMNYFNSKLS